LEELFAQYDFHHTMLKSPALVAMAIFFHDIVYSDTNVGLHPKNEMESAELFRTFAAEVGLTPEDTDTVTGWIERTAHHLQGKAEGDLAYFLDFDLAVLGKSPAQYAQYTQQVRMEYAQVPLAAFNAKRATFMPQFLASETLYFTDEFRQTHEDQARTNVENEVKRLTAGWAGQSSL
jgi:predicted metal-dependent HD superfamily phosphohydrolase